MSTFPTGNFVFNVHYSLIFNLGFIFLDVYDIWEHLVSCGGWGVCTSLLEHETGFLTPKNEIHCPRPKEWGKRKSSDFCLSDLQISYKGKIIIHSPICTNVSNEFHFGGISNEFSAK